MLLSAVDILIGFSASWPLVTKWGMKTLVFVLKKSTLDLLIDSFITIDVTIKGFRPKAYHQFERSSATKSVGKPKYIFAEPNSAI